MTPDKVSLPANGVAAEAPGSAPLIEQANQHIESLARDSAALWAVRQHLHDYLEPDDDVPEAAKRAIDEIATLRRKWQSDTHLFNGAWQILKENKLVPDSTELLAAADRFEKNGLCRPNK